MVQHSRKEDKLFVFLYTKFGRRDFRSTRLNDNFVRKRFVGNN